MLRSTAIALLLVLTACGAEIEPVPNTIPPASEAGYKDGPKKDAPTGPEEPANEPSTSTIAPPVHLQNTSDAARWIVLDSQSTPVDFEVGVPALQLNGYGSYWCGGPDDLHNDPFARVQRIEPGEVAKIYWRPIAVTREGDCWRGTPLSGTYATKACFYESEPTGINVPGDEATNATIVCKDVSLVVDSSSSSEIVLSF